MPEQHIACVLEGMLDDASFPVPNRDCPQRDALTWIANEDPLVLDLAPDTSYEVLSRYALAVLYEATNGTDWRLGTIRGSKSPIVTCDWTDVACSEGGSNITKLGHQTQQC